VVVNDIGGAVDGTGSSTRAADGVVEEIRAAGGEAVADYGSVADPEQAAQTVRTAIESFGSVDIVISNAGILRDRSFANMTLDEMNAVVDVHLRGAFLMSRACQKYMVEQRWGRIVNISSTSALGNRGQANYATAKAGLQGLAKTLAIELGPFGVTANAVAPGFIETDMTAATAARVGMDFETFKKAAAEQIPVRRVGRPEDIAHTVSFLVSEGAGFVSGQVIYVAGGPRN